MERPCAVDPDVIGESYRNPILRADWSDPDAIRVGEDFYLIASSFHRVPGLPVLHSRDLVHWSIIGHALGRLEPAAEFAVPRHGCGVWAPAIRHHAGLFWIFYPDPDRGIFVINAPSADGPWSAPHLLKAGRGLIDPCPLWDADGSAYLVHAWARSRAGINNRITCQQMSPDATRLLDAGRTIIDGDHLPGYSTLEGPKAYRRDGWYWIFAPAGGVANGWQSAFRARHIFGPYEARIVLAQGDTDINGPHQGAWVDTHTGQDWFLHFQDRGVYGRVVHLQPMRWGDDGWPYIGRANGARPGTPVTTHPLPDVGDLSKRDGTDYGGTGTKAVPAKPQTSDDFAGQLGPQWTWAANPEPSWMLPRPRGLRLICGRSPDVADLRRLPQVLGQRLPMDPATATTTLTLSGDTPGARAGLTVLGRRYAWIGLERTAAGVDLVCRAAAAAPTRTASPNTASTNSVGGFGDATVPGGAEEDLAAPLPLPVGQTTAVLRVDIGPGAVCQFQAAVNGGPPQAVGHPFVASPGHWTGATLGLFAAAPQGDGPAGHADIVDFEVTGG